MKLVPEAKNGHKLWSVRLAIIAAALGAAELSLPLWDGVVSNGVFAAMSSVVAIGAAVARVIKQEGISDG